MADDVVDLVAAAENSTKQNKATLLMKRKSIESEHAHWLAKIEIW